MRSVTSRSVATILIYGLLAVWLQPSQAASGEWTTGKNYDELSNQIPKGNGGTVEVIEFFWYACPHCYRLEPEIESWLKAKPNYVAFKRIPITWDPRYVAHARLYFALASLNRLDLSPDVFSTIYNDRNFLLGSTDEQTYEKQLKFVGAHGVQAGDFLRAYHSAPVEANLQQARDLMDKYGIAHVPTFVIAGRYRTSAQQVGGELNLLPVVDLLVQRAHSDSLVSTGAKR